MVGCYARHTVVNEASVIPVDPAVPPEAACLTGCGAATGWGSAVYAGGVRAGDDVAVIGVGGLGSAAVQGARLAGARHVFAVDPVPFKREMAGKFGATHTARDAGRGVRPDPRGYLGPDVRRGGADDGVGRGDLMDDFIALTAKRGRIVVTNIHPVADTHPRLSLIGLAQWEKQIVGCIFGSVNSRADIPRLLGLYRDGLLDLDVDGHQHLPARGH